MSFLAQARGASPAVANAISPSDRDRRRPEIALCPMCGETIDFHRPDPTGLGRTMQGCSNRRCPDHASRPMPLRRM